jgi:hypothetical protein
MIDTIIEDFPQHRIIIGGDLNTELRGITVFDEMWFNLMKKWNLKKCDDLTMNKDTCG